MSKAIVIDVESLTRLFKLSPLQYLPILSPDAEKDAIHRVYNFFLRQSFDGYSNIQKTSKYVSHKSRVDLLLDPQ